MLSKNKAPTANVIQKDLVYCTGDIAVTVKCITERHDDSCNESRQMTLLQLTSLRVEFSASSV